MPAHPLWKTDKGLQVGGPAGFGLNIPFRVSEIKPTEDVIDKFGTAA